MDTRRRTVLAAGAAGAAALVAGCGDGGGGEDPATRPPAPKEDGGTPSPADEELTSTGEIPVGGGRVFADRKVVVTQPEAGDFKAFSAVCTHQGCTVANVSDGTINCLCHSSKFQIDDGSVASGPATKPLPAQPITVSGDSIRVD
ncbi:Rieske (2Fe-2S) protein [Streptomyces peucetius]|uniref:Cytochrome bc1 complex Rieske iron-sulfur subunit n=1 Tax=Streptomyces peucetius TaxID=1950 RepID=A0ABY6I656_STRPE|nr:Rieske (2Fe-2S) protein [Streptomyces peucetius]UYQ61352.1 Rieske (2Fe-2S) protein [Streptomyces peucetius]